MSGVMFRASALRRLRSGARRSYWCKKQLMRLNDKVDSLAALISDQHCAILSAMEDLVAQSGPRLGEGSQRQDHGVCQAHDGAKRTGKETPSRKKGGCPNSCSGKAESEVSTVATAQRDSSASSTSPESEVSTVATAQRDGSASSTGPESEVSTVAAAQSDSSASSTGPESEVSTVAKNRRETSVSSPSRCRRVLTFDLASDDLDESSADMATSSDAAEVVQHTVEHFDIETQYAFDNVPTAVPGRKIVMPSAAASARFALIRDAVAWCHDYSKRDGLMAMRALLQEAKDADVTSLQALGLSTPEEACEVHVWVEADIVLRARDEDDEKELMAGLC